jgi:mannose-6-phosphate isomerase-like protein (cupin superfamily)
MTNRPEETGPRSPLEAARALEEYWSPKVIAELDEHFVKVAKLKGRLCWHAHDEEDELFYVLSGRLRIELRDRTVELAPGELFAVPKGVEHNPIADEECLVMLVERKSTQHTGDQVSKATRSIEEQLK